MRPLLFLCCLATAGCAARATPEVLLEADRAFARHALEHGIQSAFTEYAAQDAWVLRRSGLQVGKDAVKTTFEGTENVDLRWEPKGGQISGDGEVGFTWGTWTRALKNDGSGRQQTGRYLTTWRRAPDGSYRWTCDLGDTDPPAP